MNYILLYECITFYLTNSLLLNIQAMYRFVTHYKLYHSNILLYKPLADFLRYIPRSRTTQLKAMHLFFFF